MSRPDPLAPTRPRADWWGWLALAWALGVGLLYSGMVLRERVPGILRALGRLAGSAWDRV